MNEDNQRPENIPKGIEVICDIFTYAERGTAQRCFLPIYKFCNLYGKYKTQEKE